MNKRVKNIGFVLLFIVGLSILLYPSVSDMWNEYRAQQLIEHYTKTVSCMTKEENERSWEEAKQYNQQKKQNSFEYETLSMNQEELEQTVYGEMIHVDEGGMMGYIEIPKISQRIPIYHGTSDEVLQKGAGHMAGTSLPVGGISTHAVISGHRGLPSAKLFTDLDQLEDGDEFEIHVLGKTLIYKVDQILPMVDKDDLDTLQDAMQIVEGKDYVTLITCTPYGVNSHRLLVRGERVKDSNKGEQQLQEEAHKGLERKNTRLYLILAGLGVFAFLILFQSMRNKRRNKHENRKT